MYDDVMPPGDFEMSFYEIGSYAQSDSGVHRRKVNCCQISEETYFQIGKSKQLEGSTVKAPSSLASRVGQANDGPQKGSAMHLLRSHWVIFILRVIWFLYGNDLMIVSSASKNQLPAPPATLLAGISALCDQSGTVG